MGAVVGRNDYSLWLYVKRKLLHCLHTRAHTRKAQKGCLDGRKVSSLLFKASCPAEQRIPESLTTFSCAAAGNFEAAGLTSNEISTGMDFGFPIRMASVTPRAGPPLTTAMTAPKHRQFSSKTKTVTLRFFHRATASSMQGTSICSSNKLAGCAIGEENAAPRSGHSIPNCAGACRRRQGSLLQD